METQNSSSCVPSVLVKKESYFRGPLRQYMSIMYVDCQVIRICTLVKCKHVFTSTHSSLHTVWLRPPAIGATACVFRNMEETNTDENIYHHSAIITYMQMFLHGEWASVLVLTEIMQPSISERGSGKCSEPSLNTPATCFWLECLMTPDVAGIRSLVR